MTVWLSGCSMLLLRWSGKSTRSAHIGQLRRSSAYGTQWFHGFFSTAKCSSSSAFVSTFMWGRWWNASIELGLALPPLTILSPTIRYWCYPTTFALVFLSFFSPVPPSPSLSCLHILILFPIHAHTTSTYFQVPVGLLSWIFLPPSLSL